MSKKGFLLKKKHTILRILKGLCNFVPKDLKKSFKYSFYVTTSNMLIAYFVSFVIWIFLSNHIIGRSLIGYFFSFFNPKIGYFLKTQYFSEFFRQKNLLQIDKKVKICTLENGRLLELIYIYLFFIESQYMLFWALPL